MELCKRLAEISQFVLIGSYYYWCTLYNNKMCRFGYNILFDNNKSITCYAKTILSENTQINHQGVYQTPKDNS